MPEVIPGDDRSPVLLHVPHAGTDVPAWTRPHLLLDDDALAAELAALTDHRTDALAAAAADRARIRPWAVVNPVSRFVVDVERFPDAREEMARVGMGAVYTHGTRGQRLRDDDPGHRAALLAAFFGPWADTVESLVAQRIAATGRAVLLDVHSYPRDPLPYEPRRAVAAGGRGDPRPPVCLGTDRAHTPGRLVDAAVAAFGEVGRDTPFAGAYVPLSRHGADPRVRALMIEIRRDVHDAEPDRLARAGAVLVDAVT